VAVAVVGWVVHVRWHVPAISASRRRAVLAGQVRVDSAAGPTVSSGMAVDWGSLASRQRSQYLMMTPSSCTSILVRRFSDRADSPAEDVVVAGNDLRLELRRLDLLFTSATSCLATYSSGRALHACSRSE